MTEDIVVGEDGLARCGWGAAPPEYRAYHDCEWGRPVRDENRIFEKLCLEGFQSGLSWLTILRRRDTFRAAFASFDPAVVAGFGDADVERLLADPGIIRHRGKIMATIGNARAALALHERGLTLAELLWRYEPPPRRAPRKLGDVPPTTPESKALSAELRRGGFRFVGPTTVYAAMQSLGVVNDHLAGCHQRGSADAARTGR